MKQFSFLALLCTAVLALTACSGFAGSLDLQDDYFKDFSGARNAESIVLHEVHHPSVSRGLIATTYSATLPQGEYVAVASSRGRVFYQAPAGFGYFKRDTLQSAVGGVVQLDAGDTANFYIWFFPKEQDHFEIDPDGDWHKSVKPGMLNVVGRPWVEADLKVTLPVN